MLKTNYVNDLYTGNRQYDIDGSLYEIIDATEYTVVGDEFGAQDINKTNTYLNIVSGFVSKTTTFNPDGSVTEANQDNSIVKTTTFPTDTTVVETLVTIFETITKTTTFNVDGTISEVIS